MIAYCGIDCESCPIHLATLEPDNAKRDAMRTSVAQLCRSVCCSWDGVLHAANDGSNRHGRSVVPADSRAGLRLSVLSAPRSLLQQEVWLASHVVDSGRPGDSLDFRSCSWVTRRDGLHDRSDHQSTYWVDRNCPASVPALLYPLVLGKESEKTMDQLDIVEYFRSLPSLAGLGSPCWKSNEATVAGLILNLTLENVI